MVLDELVVAPVTITPTKPLTPTHVKGLLWTDILVKASALAGHARLLWNDRMATLTTQSTAFWQYLDRVEPDTDWSRESAALIGERYVRFHTEGGKSDPRVVGAYLERVDTSGWIHPAGRRVLDSWRAELDLLGVGDLGPGKDRPLAAAADTTLEALAERGLLVDHRRFGGPVHLDGTRWGLPLRQLVGSDGHPNYLLPILRELIPAIGPGRVFLLVFDDGLASDYLLLDRVLSAFGGRSVRLAFSRVPVDGAVRSSRYGGWRGCTLSDLSAVSGSADRAAYRLGMRLYFAGVLPRRSAQPFRMPVLRRCVGRAARLLTRTAADVDGCVLPEALSRSRDPNGFVDPYRLTTSLLGPLPADPRLLRIYT